jgi:hypothetical protein
MFEKAIIESQQYTRPILSVLRSYSNQLLPAAGTMFFVNHTGAAVTCKHVAEVIISGDKLWQKFQAFQAEKALLLKGESFDNELILLEQKYEFNSNATVQLHYFSELF